MRTETEVAAVGRSPRRALTWADLKMMVDVLLTLQEAVDVLRVKPSWLYGKIHDGTLPFPYTKVGRHVRFPSNGLRKYIEDQTKGSAA